MEQAPPCCRRPIWSGINLAQIQSVSFWAKQKSALRAHHVGKPALKPGGAGAAGVVIRCSVLQQSKSDTYLLYNLQTFR